MLTAFLAGLLFGAGLILSGMTNPANVLAFFDVAGEWNPSLAFVMAAGLAVTWLGYGVAARKAPLPVAPSAAIDARLVGGAAIFGVGWGLAGYCPGPAIAASAGGVAEALVFTAAMVAGMLAWKLAAWRVSTCPYVGALKEKRAEKIKGR